MRPADLPSKDYHKSSSEARRADSSIGIATKDPWALKGSFSEPTTPLRRSFSSSFFQTSESKFIGQSREDSFKERVFSVTPPPSARSSYNALTKLALRNTSKNNNSSDLDGVASLDSSIEVSSESGSNLRPPLAPSSSKMAKKESRISSRENSSRSSPQIEQMDSNQLLQEPSSQGVIRDDSLRLLSLEDLPSSEKSSPNVSRNSSSGTLAQAFPTAGTLRPPPLFMGNASPQTPKNYAMQATEIRERRTIFNSFGESCRISDERSAKRGRFSSVYDLLDPFPRIHPDISNEEIVVKILQDKHVRKATKFIGHSIDQYEFLRNFFEKEERPPIVKIYNPENAVSLGYTLVERVRPLNKAPWDNNSSIDELSLEGKSALDSIAKLLKANSSLDLKWDNLGVKKDGTVALLDYDNIPFSLPVTDSYSSRLSGGNPYVARHIENLEKDLRSEEKAKPS